MASTPTPQDFPPVSMPLKNPLRLRMKVRYKPQEVVRRKLGIFSTKARSSKPLLPGLQINKKWLFITLLENLPHPQPAKPGRKAFSFQYSHFSNPALTSTRSPPYPWRCSLPSAPTTRASPGLWASRVREKADAASAQGTAAQRSLQPSSRTKGRAGAPRPSFARAGGGAPWGRGRGQRAGPHPAARKVALVSLPPPAPPPAPRPRLSDGLSRALPSRATELALTSSAVHGRAAAAATSAPG